MGPFCMIALQDQNRAMIGLYAKSMWTTVPEPLKHKNSQTNN